MKKVLLSKYCPKCKKYKKTQYGTCPKCSGFLLEGKTKRIKEKELLFPNGSTINFNLTSIVHRHTFQPFYLQSLILPQVDLIIICTACGEKK